AVVGSASAGGTNSVAADLDDDPVHAVWSAAVGAGSRSRERVAEAAGACRARRARAVDADHAVRGPDAARGDPRAGASHSRLMQRANCFRQLSVSLRSST